MSNLLTEQLQTMLPGECAKSLSAALMAAKDPSLGWIHKEQRISPEACSKMV